MNYQSSKDAASICTSFHLATLTVSAADHSGKTRPIKMSLCPWCHFRLSGSHL